LNENNKGISVNILFTLSETGFENFEDLSFKVLNEEMKIVLHEIKQKLLHE